MKKLSILMAFMLIFTMAAPVFAAPLDKNTTTGSVTVTYEVAESYTVSIPASFDFTAESLSNIAEVSASNVLIENGKELNVTMTSANYSDNKYTLNYEGSKITYTVKQGETNFTNAGEVLSIASGTTSGSASLTFATTNDEIAKATKSGAHTDTLTFTVAVAAQ